LAQNRSQLPESAKSESMSVHQSHEFVPVAHAGVQTWFSAVEKFEAPELQGLIEDRGFLPD